VARNIRDGSFPAAKFGGILIQDLENTIAELREEFERIRLALAALERLAAGGKRRGRPPKWLVKVRNSQKEVPEPKKRVVKGLGKDVSVKAPTTSDSSTSSGI
jgi:hypothetical protein